MATSEYRNMLGLGSAGYAGAHSLQPGMNNQPYYQPEEEEDDYVNRGYYNRSWDEIAENRDALRKNPYGDMEKDRGGERTYAEWARQAGKDVADPNTLNDFLKILAGHRGPWNATGTENPYNKNQYPWLGGALRNITKGMTRPEKARYRQSRFVYDNGLRGGLSDTNTYENKRNMEAANPGSSKDLRSWGGGTWERDNLVEVPEVFGKNIGGV